MLIRWITPALADEVLADAGRAAGGRMCPSRFRRCRADWGCISCLFGDMPYRAAAERSGAALILYTGTFGNAAPTPPTPPILPAAGVNIVGRSAPRTQN
jgi:hypothetical protein